MDVPHEMKHHFNIMHGGARIVERKWWKKLRDKREHVDVSGMIKQYAGVVKLYTRQMPALKPEHVCK